MTLHERSGSAGGAQEFVNAFLHEKDVRAAVRLLDDDVVFVGPLLSCTGKAAYAALLENFLPAHVETRVLRQLAEGDEVCSMNELVVRAPTGEILTLALAEWFKLRGGLIAEHRVFYDPRAFARAFGIS
jgi:ketosteroid isomerase-like protein